MAMSTPPTWQCCLAVGDRAPGALPTPTVTAMWTPRILRRYCLPEARVSEESLVKLERNGSPGAPGSEEQCVNRAGQGTSSSAFKDQ